MQALRHRVSASWLLSLGDVGLWTQAVFDTWQGLKPYQDTKSLSFGVGAWGLGFLLRDESLNPINPQTPNPKVI